MNQSRTHRPIGLGDLIRSIGDLKLSDSELEMVAAMLGLMRPKGNPSVEDDAQAGGTGLQTRADASAAATDPARLVTPLEVPAGAGLPEAAQAGAGRVTGWAGASPGAAWGEGEIELTFVGTDVPPARSWISEAKELAQPVNSTAPPYEATVPSFMPLLAPSVTRAVVVEATATQASHGPVDIGRLVRDVAMRCPVLALPCLPATTLRRGAQILVDRASSMQPFQIDANHLAARIREVTSHGATQLLYFDEDPTIVDDSWPVSEGRPHELPPAGTPIVVISDLGIRNLRSHRSHAQSHWLGFAIGARRRGCPVIIFVPYPSSRWPRGLGGLVMQVPWDRNTAVATVRAARRGVGR